MGMDLVGREGDFQFNMFAWENALRLAEMYGWEPAGTLAPEPRVMDEEDEDEEPFVFKDWNPGTTAPTTASG